MERSETAAHDFAEENAARINLANEKAKEARVNRRKAYAKLIAFILVIVVLVGVGYRVWFAPDRLINLSVTRTEAATTPLTPADLQKAVENGIEKKMADTKKATEATRSGEPEIEEEEGKGEDALPPGYTYVSRGPAAGVKGGKTCDYRLEPGHHPWIKGEGIKSVTLVVNKHTGNIYGADSHAVPNEFKKFGDCRFVEIKQTVNGVDYWRPTVVLDE